MLLFAVIICFSINSCIYLHVFYDLNIVLTKKEQLIDVEKGAAGLHHPPIGRAQ
jgi:hypothetical protein